MDLIKYPAPYKDQYAQLGKHRWSVHRLVNLSKDIPTLTIPLEHLNLWHKYDLTMREMAGHVKAILAADLKYPILLDEDGEILDGRHRLMKAILLKKKTIKAKRFLENPPPCSIDGNN